jgi:hypothetical protein
MATSQLIVIVGPDAGRFFPIPADGVLSIGRGAQSHTRLVDLSVSRMHCDVRLEGERVIVCDANSASGTFVNGQRITRQELRAGDVIQVGDTQMRFDQPVTDDTTIVPGKPGAPTKAVVTPTNPTRVPPPPVSSTPPPPPDIVFANRAGGRALPKPIKDLLDLAGSSIGSYKVLDTVGTGQTGVVFKALDTKDQKIVALKVLRADFAKDKKAMQRFVRGMMTMRTVTHPNLVELYNAGVTGTHCWMALEFVDGCSVADIMQQIAGTSPRDWKIALRVATDIAAGLGFMHESGMIHRNVIPQNILVQKSDQAAKLGDAMLAKALEGNATPEVSTSGEFVGNIYYMAPERSQRGAAVDSRSDFFSLGVTLYSLLTGKMPFAGTSLPEVINKVRQANPDRPRAMQPAIPDAFEAVVLKLLAKRPEDRYPTAKELLADLRRVP